MVFRSVEDLLDSIRCRLWRYRLVNILSTLSPSRTRQQGGYLLFQTQQRLALIRCWAGRRGYAQRKWTP